MKQLVCLADTPWSGAPTRTQQLMARLKQVQILYFEPPARRRGKPWKQPGRRVRPGLVVYALPPVLDEEENSRLIFRAGQRKLERYVEKVLLRHRVQDPVLWCASPSAVHLLDAVPSRGIVYDCGRDWSHLPDQWESELALAADVVFAASPELADHIGPCSDNVALLPNGANYSMFARDDLEVPAALRDIRGPVLGYEGTIWHDLDCSDNVALLPNGANYSMFARDDLEVPAALRDIRGPVLGYEGTIWHDLDLEPLLRSAREQPDVTFVLVGRVERNPALRALEALPNVRILGWKPLVELPEYLARFDVCLNLLRRGSMEADILPPRIFEYFATGKPVVSMLQPGQVEQFPDVIYGANTAAEFSQLCRSALAERGTWARERRRSYGRAGSWTSRAGEVERILESIGLF